MEKYYIANGKQKESQGSNTQTEQTIRQKLQQQKQDFPNDQGQIPKDFTIVNISITNIGAPEYVKQILTKNKG